jgi:hypothetical protein
MRASTGFSGAAALCNSIDLRIGRTPGKPRRQGRLHRVRGAAGCVIATSMTAMPV